MQEFVQVHKDVLHPTEWYFTTQSNEYQALMNLRARDLEFNPCLTNVIFIHFLIIYDWQDCQTGVRRCWHRIRWADWSTLEFHQHKLCMLRDSQYLRHFKNWWQNLYAGHTFNSPETIVPSWNIRCLNGCLSTLNKGRWAKGGNVRCRILSAFLWC